MNRGIRMLDFFKMLVDEEITGYLASAWNMISGGVYIAMIFFALFNCFLGYRMMKFWFAVCGLAVGAYGGYYLGLVLWKGMLWFVVALFCAVLVSFLTTRVKQLGLFLTGACLALTGFYGLFGWPLWLVCAAAVLAGVISIAAERCVFILLTGIAGAFGVAYFTAMLLNRYNALLGETARIGLITILLTLFCIAGILVQWFTTRSEEERVNNIYKDLRRPEDGKLYRLLLRCGFGGYQAPLLSVMAMAVSAVPICIYLALGLKNSGGEAHYIFSLFFIVLTMTYSVITLRKAELGRDIRQLSMLWPPMAVGWCVYYGLLLVLSRVMLIKNGEYYALAAGGICSGILLVLFFMRRSRGANGPLSVWFILASGGAIAALSISAHGFDTWLVLELAFRLGFCALGISTCLLTKRYIPTAPILHGQTGSERETHLEEMTRTISGLFSLEKD